MGGKIDEIAENQDYTAIPLEEDLSTLEDFLNDGQPTKASAISRGDYEVSRFAFNVDTKALNSLSSVPSGDILYCVNFKNDGGSAVLAANTIVKDPIVCVTEKGSITADDITKSSNRLLDMPYMEKTDFIITRNTQIDSEPNIESNLIAEYLRTAIDNPQSSLVLSDDNVEKVGKTARA